MLDVSVLQLLKTRERYEVLNRAVPTKALGNNAVYLLKAFGKFFKENPECERIPFDAFHSWFQLSHPKLSDEQRTVWKRSIKEALTKDCDTTVAASLVERLVSAATAADLASMLEQYEEGELDLTAALRILHDKHFDTMARKVKMPEIIDNISDLLIEDANNVGLHWRLQALSENLRALQAGDFVVLGARPDAGKTTTIASEITYMAPQIDKLWPGENKCIAWFNNEGPGKRIKRRVYQAALNMTIKEMWELDQKKLLHKEYAKAMGGRADVIRIFDIHDFWSHEVEDIIREIPTALAIFDMVDNIRFGGEIGNGGTRTDQALEAMYQWSRVLGVKHGCATMATSQVSADGEGEMYPNQSMLKDSKTGKQGAADLIIMLGKSNADGLSNTRFISTPKNKLALEGGDKSIKREVCFDGQRARVYDPE
ncbi:replicative DNA helicase [Ralstonia phage RSB1]|uniref:Replicative DNA helicase n=1 Tax=Ralstonia phage RSB1 TaxID=551790 RepID=B5BTV3_9CAUD|nr:replicative DNA helicase [Ralstonia phage RSB1]BAG70375.1 replicative DNA helicase [Ralstonia phage RSB1]